MRRLLGLSLLFLVTVLLARQPGNPHVVPTAPLSPEEQAKKFTLPPGFEIQLVASEPQIRKPMNIAFDDAGRLWVTDSVEYPFPVKAGAKGRDTVKILSDFAANGKAGLITTFADDLSIPIGVLPLPLAKHREALVFDIPRLRRMRDTTGKGIADTREIAYQTFGSKDTHGMTNNFLLGFDGWIYACHGFSNTSNVADAKGRSITMQSGNTYRIKADGSHIEQFTFGQVNPFGLGFDKMGYLYSSDCHTEPIYQLMRGGSYPSFGKPHDGLGFAPIMFTKYRGSTAIAGLAMYLADQYPKQYQESAFVGDVITNQIVQFKSTWNGATPSATQQVFAECSDRWFRPVDIKLGPDGALYIADFYNRIIGHYEVPLDHPGRDRERGRIWRIVYTGKDHKGTAAPREDWTKASIAELAKDLQHPNQTIQFLATQQLVQRAKAGEAKKVAEALKEIRGSHALWVRERSGVLDESALEHALHKGDEIERVHACRILAERPTVSEKQREQLQSALKDASAHVRRVAAETLGVQVDASNVRALLDLRHKVDPADSHLLHTVRIALRNQLVRDENYKRVGKIDEADARAIADVSLGVKTSASARFLVGHIQENRYPMERLSEFVHHVARYGETGDVQSLVRFCSAHEPKNLSAQSALLRAVERGTQERGRALSAETKIWVGELIGRLVKSERDQDVRLGCDLIISQRVTTMEPTLLELAAKGSTPKRLAAMDALLKLDQAKHVGSVAKPLDDEAQPSDLREQLANLLARANQPQTREALLKRLPTAPATFQTTIAGALGQTREGGEALLAMIASGKASARLLQNQGLVVRLRTHRYPGFEEKLKKLTQGIAPADAKLAELIASRKKAYLAGKPDEKRGLELFAKHCANCHQIEGKGAKIGPQLDGIGLRGLERLLEDTLDPNRNVDEAFRTTQLTLESGSVVSGLLLREEGAVLVLGDAQGKEVRVEKAKVEMRHTSPMSPMPANFGEQIVEKEFVDLLAYLIAQSKKK